jgi:hypothetical protein
MCNGQPGVADPTMERLVEEKVDMFWKGLENVALKRGQVRLRKFYLGDINHTDICELSKISVTLSKKDQRKAWLGITTYEGRHTLSGGITQAQTNTNLFELYRRKSRGSNGTYNVRGLVL